MIFLSSRNAVWGHPRNIHSRNNLLWSQGRARLAVRGPIWAAMLPERRPWVLTGARRQVSSEQAGASTQYNFLPVFCRKNNNSLKCILVHLHGHYKWSLQKFTPRNVHVDLSPISSAPSVLPPLFWCLASVAPGSLVLVARFTVRSKISAACNVFSDFSVSISIPESYSISSPGRHIELYGEWFPNMETTLHFQITTRFDFSRYVYFTIT